MRTHALAASSALALLILAGSAPAASREVPAADFYVATDGNDAWSGKLAAPDTGGTDGPFATLTRARDAVREAGPAGDKPRTVLIRGGIYRLDEPIVFSPDDSGVIKSVITYAAYPDEQPVFSGGRVITGWKRGRGDIWTARVPEAAAGRWYFHQLFVNGRRRTRARTPNEGYLRTDGPLPGIKNPHAERQNPEAKLGFKYRPGDLKKWDNLEDVNLFIYHSWTASLNWIASLDDEQHIVRLTAPTNWPLGYWERKQRYRVENYLEALDAPGEWYLDRKTGMLHYWPVEGEDMTRAVVEAPVLRKLVEFRGDYAAGRFVEHLRLQGLSFQHATWYVKDRGPADGQAAAWLEAAVFARGMRYCSIEDCEIAHVGEYGLYLERGCQHNFVARCQIHDLGAGGLRIGHMSSPKDDNAATHRNNIDNCFIHSGGHVFPAGVGVWLGRTSHNTVTHNEIADFFYTGISVGWSWGYAPSSANHNGIQYNRVHLIGQGVLSDMGGIYTLGDSPGTVVSHNIFHDVYSYAYGGWGLYTDEGSTGIVMSHNVVYDTKTGGFHQHYGKENVVRNNILAFSREHQIQRSREEDHLSFTFERNIVYFDNGSLLGGRWKNGNWKMDYNDYWDTSSPEIEFAGMTFDEWKAKGSDRHSIIADPRFVDAAAREFRLKPDSPALALGFEPIDMRKVGLYGEPEWVALPDHVQYRSFTIPPPPEPKPIEDGFEESAVGEPADNASTIEENDIAVIRVTDARARRGSHSLKFIDKPGQERPWSPYLYYQPSFRTGLVHASFALYREPGAVLYHEWRDSHDPYRVGPSLWFLADDQLTSLGKRLTTVPAGKWVQLDIRCGLGAQAAGTFDLVVTVDGQPPQRFDKLPCGKPGFRTLTWFGFVADKQVDCVFYLDDLSVRPEAEGTAARQRVLERVRRQSPSKAPEWVNAIPDRIGAILVSKHYYPDGQVWGLARRTPDQELPYDEMGSATFIGLVKQYDLFDKVGPLDEDARRKAVAFWQAWQDPDTGRFKDPRDPDREVNEKYVVGAIGALGGEPLYPWTTTGTSKTIETDVFLRRTKDDPDWARGGWGVGSHTCFMAVEILDAINDGQLELIPALEQGLEQVFTHQDPASGLWGPPSAELMRRIGGTLKVVGRLYFAMGMRVPHTRELTDALIAHQQNGDWFRYGANSCVPRNVAEVVAYCLEVSDYRRDELLDTLEGLAHDYRAWVNPDGSTLVRRGDRDSVGLQYTTIYGLGILGAYLNWEDCRLPNPLAGSRRGLGLRYRPSLRDDSHVKVIDTRAENE